VRTFALSLLFLSACAQTPIAPPTPPTAAPAPLPPDLLSLVPLAGPFSSLDQWCRRQPTQLGCDQLENPVGEATILNVAGPGRTTLLVVGMHTATGWYAGLAPNCTDGRGCSSGRLEQQSPAGGPPVFLFRYEPELGQSFRIEWLLLCIGGNTPACSAAVIPLRARGVDGASLLALHVDISFGNVLYRQGKLAFALRADKREVAGRMPDAVEWRRRLSLLSGPHLLPLPAR